jgi:hypothetical protein
MQELGDEFHKFYYAHPKMETVPSLSLVPRHLHTAVMNALQQHWEGERATTHVNPPEIIGATHMAVHPTTGEDKFLHPHEVAQHKMEGWHVSPLEEPVPQTSVSEGLKSPEQISLLYAGPTWLSRKYDNFFFMRNLNDFHKDLGRPQNLKETPAIRPTQKDMNIVTYEDEFRGKKYHSEPFHIVTSAPSRFAGESVGWWGFGADHRTGDISLWAN